MKTTFTNVTGFLFILFFTATAYSQNGAAVSKKNTESIHPDYVSQLLNEINAMRSKAAKLRARAINLPYEDQASALIYAEQLEKKSTEKHLEALSMDFAINSKIYSGNKETIRTLQLKNTQKTNIEHLQFLLKEAAKNNKIAMELFQEVETQGTMELKIGHLSNAEEKILAALEQQNQAIEILRKSAPGLAKS